MKSIRSITQVSMNELSGRCEYLLIPRLNLYRPSLPLGCIAIQLRGKIRYPERCQREKQVYRTLRATVWPTVKAQSQMLCRSETSRSNYCFPDLASAMIVISTFKYRMSSARDGEKALGITTYVIPRGPFKKSIKKKPRNIPCRSAKILSS